MLDSTMFVDKKTQKALKLEKIRAKALDMTDIKFIEAGLFTDIIS